jgi:diamine N-acetyltransferase
MKIDMRDVTRENFVKCISLDVAEDQRRFVATNVVSIAQSKIMPELIPQVLYAGEEMVGFLLYGLDPDDGRWWLGRLMIDKAQQGKGYGKAAVRALMERLAVEAPECHELYLSFVPTNARAERLYRNLGFEPTGEADQGGEVVYRRALD